ncbi:MAG TPA: radical SAM protein [Chloroflexota bacterium]|nr:radical SAM protein [Chloroflexota bacterium]
MFSAAYVASSGQLREARGRAPVAFNGQRLIPLEADELIPLPSGCVVSMLPDRMAVSADGPLPGAPAAALLPIGYTRTLLPAYDTRHVQPAPDAAFLPLFGYTAVAMRDGSPYVAAMPTDDPRPWQHPDAGYRRLRRLVRQRVAQAEEQGSAALLRHLAHCALSYECRSAQHIFYQQGEGALPSSPTCNAACVGCISDQPDPEIQPHERLSFLPDVDEAVDLAVRHLESAPRAIVSFGQGCEGEPLLNKRNLEIVRRIRQRTDKGVININTNGSLPQMLNRLIDAGLGSIRVSVFSAVEGTFRRYYRPVRYSLEQVRACLRLAADNGLATSVNLLTFPGITDDAAEVEAMVEMLTSTGTQLVQLRNLNIDPEQLLGAFDGVEFAPVGIRRMAQRFREAGLAIGSYTHVR